MSDLLLRDGLSVVCFTRQGAASPFFAIREFDTKILRLPTGREGGNLRVQGVSEQAIRARITQVMMKLQLVPFKGLKSEVKILKQRGILGKRAPKCSLLKGADMVNLLRAFGKDSFANDLDRALQDFKKKPRTLKPRTTFAVKQGATPENNRIIRRGEAVKRSLKFQGQLPAKRKKSENGTLLSQSPSLTSQNQAHTLSDPLTSPSSKMLRRPLSAQSSPLVPHKKPTVNIPVCTSPQKQSTTLENENTSRETQDIYPAEQSSEKSLNCDPDPMASQNLLQASVTDVPALTTMELSKPETGPARMKSYDNDAPPLLQHLTRTSRARARAQARWNTKQSTQRAWGGSETLAGGCTTTSFPPISLPSRTSEETSLAGMPSVYPFKSSFNTRADANTWTEINQPKSGSQENLGKGSDASSRMGVLSPPSTFNFEFSTLSKMMFTLSTPSKFNFDLSALDSFIESLPDSPGHPSVTISTETLSDYDNGSSPYSDVSSDGGSYWRTCQVPSLLPSLLH